MDVIGQILRMYHWNSYNLMRKSRFINVSIYFPLFKNTININCCHNNSPLVINRYNSHGISLPTASNHSTIIQGTIMTSIYIYSLLSSKSHNPHYLNRYWNFIQYCQMSNLSKEFLEHTEKHHILPK